MESKGQLPRKRSVHMVGWSQRRSGNCVYILAGAKEITALRGCIRACMAEDTYKNKINNVYFSIDPYDPKTHNV